MSGLSSVEASRVPDARALVRVCTRSGIAVSLPGEIAFAAGVEPDVERLEAAERWLRPVPPSVEALAQRVLVHAMQRRLVARHGTRDVP